MKTSRRHLAQQNIISQWLEQNGDMETSKLVEKNLAIAHRIQSLLEAKGMKDIDLAKALNKNKSEISKWLSGTHTFTTKTIVKIETVLQEEIISVPSYIFSDELLQVAEPQVSYNKKI